MDMINTLMIILGIDAILLTQFSQIIHYKRFRILR